MVGRLSQKKIVITVGVVLVFISSSSYAKETFVSYKDAQAVLATPARSVEPGTIQPDDLRAEQVKGTELLIIDARTKEEYERERLFAAKLPRDSAYYKEAELFRQKIVPQSPNSKIALERAMRNISRTIPIITYCNSHCGLSKTLKLDLEDMGFTNVRWLDGGIDIWREKGYPLEKN